jgi:hypothetical protein
MAGIGAGDDEAVWRLYDLGGPAVRAIVRREAERIGVRLAADDLDGLTLDGVLELADLAGSWRPDGALPWVWARRRLEALVHRHVGSFACPFDETLHDIEQPSPGPAPVEALEALRRAAQRHPSARLLQGRLADAVSARDAAIWVAVQIERGAGNRSPAVTVGAYHDLSPVAVRKVVERVGRRIGPVPQRTPSESTAA